MTANSFYIRDNQKSLELYTSSKEEKEKWMEALFLAIKSLYSRKASLRVAGDESRANDSDIGGIFFNVATYIEYLYFR